MHMTSKKSLHQPSTVRGLVKTLNKMGYMMEMGDPYRDAFMAHALKTGGWVMEIGAAYGLVSLEILHRGGQVIVNDLEPRHLQLVTEKVPESLKKNFKTLSGKFPQETNLPMDSIRGVLASQVFHFLNGPELEEGFLKIYNWLQPGGKFFLIASTPYTRPSQGFITVYEERKKQGIPWPGYVDSLKAYSQSSYLENLPESMHYLDKEILGDLCQKTGFQIEKLEVFGRPDFWEDYQLDGRENVGLIAVKPE